ncbi:MAG: hypothetical protein A2538_04835 [Candidatus Magasanikbacteria bacterium RIFOXYD2_FULL_41_14]|uniref:Uncharacterized protein n=1 Tax=Candidatus Magasanikbacteria bacterium RIFOXYD2_FULL_41_14 TaxID=1798709 RepID=A0A1F6PFN5_9BACT|nr:MAG: hypothetical protein A2538_04835 [Candidatus Magasanikbacteria bacterium RIFOXYD2_FULL_41_14]
MSFFSSNTKLPEGGREFSFRYDKAGKKSLRTVLGNLARHRQHYKNLSKSNIESIVKILDKPKSRRAIRLGDGISRYQVRKDYRELRALHLADKHETTDADVGLGREIFKNYSKEEQSKQSAHEHHRPIMRLRTPDEQPVARPNHYGSIGAMVASKSNLGGSTLTSDFRNGPPKPPRIRPTF